jgi:catechol 2,3-dioxygenase-like lactoylglutathione lyase family enzyme
MDATGISHIAVCVRDLDKSLAFYRDILGMEVVFDQVQDTTTGGLPHVYQHARQTRRTVHLKFGQGSTNPRLVVTSHPSEDPDGNPIKLDQVGLSHYSFSVPDTKALMAELTAKGVQLAAPPEVWTDDQGKVSSFYVYDPDGILVQFDAGGGA